MRLMQAVGLMVVAVVAGGCGAAPSRMPTSAPAGPYAPEAKSADAAGYAGQSEGESPPAQGSPAPQATMPRSGERAWAQPPPPLAGPSEESVQGKRDRAILDDFHTAELAVMGAGNDCPAACRALRSMQRAAARLCSIAASDDERERCRAAQDRVRAARERVRSSCGQCSGGPSLDPNAPVDEP